MAMLKRDDAPLSPAPTDGDLNALLGRGSEFEGKLTFEGTVRIDGKFTGTILTDDTLVVGESATDQGRIGMGQAIMVVMLAAAGVLAVAFRASPEKALSGSIMKGGVTAIVSILGVSWLGASFFAGNETAIVGGISGQIRAPPWVFALGLFVLSILLFSQAATIVTLGPVAVALGLPASVLIVVYPAVNGNFFLPTYGTVLAAGSFGATGTTRIGGWLLNHSFMRPGLVATTVATVAGLALSRWLVAA